MTKSLDGVADLVSMSRPVMEEFSELIRNKKLKKAASLLKKETGHYLSSKQQETYLNYAVRELAGKPMRVVEVDLKKITPVRLGDPGWDQGPRYLVRKADKVFISRFMVVDHKGQGLFIDNTSAGWEYRADQVDQAFEIVFENKESGETAPAAFYPK